MYEQQSQRALQSKLPSLSFHALPNLVPPTHSVIMSAEAPALVNPLMDPQVAEYVTQWPSAVNTGFVLTMAYVVFMMQTGFLLLTVGSVRARSARSVCVKNVADAVFGGVAYFLFGMWGDVMWVVGWNVWLYAHLRLYTVHC